MFKSPTPADGVNALLDRLLHDVKDILGPQFIGMYLFGSLASGDFDNASDIDVLVVTREEIKESTFSSLAEMHQRIALLDSPWATELEVSYIPQKSLRRFDPTYKSHPRLNRGAGEVLHMMDHESDWIVQRHVLYERGITVEGPNPRSLIDPVTPDHLRQAVLDVLPFWIDPLKENPSQHLRNRGYQSFIVLSLCRMLYTVQEGGVLSKLDAAGWAKKELGDPWIPLIERAIIGRQNANLESQPEDIQGTLELIEHILDIVRQSQPRTSLPTPYPALNEVLHLLLSKAKKILGGRFAGMYLYGSLSSGDFNPASSDIDFVIATTERLADETIQELEAMHNDIWSSGLKWAAKLEGSYVPKDQLRRYEPNDLTFPTVNEGKFSIHARGADWVIQLHVIREAGVVVEGPDPKTFIDPVSPDEIRQAVTRSLNEWWFLLLDDPTWVLDRESEHHAFAVITMCRALHALEYGTIVSKPVAARWAQDRFGAPWDSLIEKALTAQYGTHAGFPNEALQFIRFTQSQIRSNGHMIRYRSYEDRDWKAICQIHDRARPDELIGSCDPRGFIPIEQDKEVEDLQRSKKFVACDDERVVGFVGVDGDYLAWLYVDPDYYGKGIGRELLRIGIQEIGEGAWTIVLDGNQRAIALYESEGFREIGRFDGDNNGYPCTCLKMKRVS